MSDLLAINVNSKTEKKNGLTYLSWAWAWAEVLKIDPLSTWEAVEFGGLPCVFLPDSSAMVKTVVTIKGHSKSCWLPVMDHRNKAIKNPDAFAINTAIVRCLTKAISMHGLGLYIYAGEDLPEDGETPTLSADQVSEVTDLVSKAGADFESLMKWVSGKIGQEVSALKDVPQNAYQPIINSLKKKAAEKAVK
jgi:hypothetical protein